MRKNLRCRGAATAHPRFANRDVACCLYYSSAPDRRRLAQNTLTRTDSLRGNTQPLSLPLVYRKHHRRPVRFIAVLADRYEDSQADTRELFPALQLRPSIHFRRGGLITGIYYRTRRSLAQAYPATHNGVKVWSRSPRERLSLLRDFG